MPTTNGGTPVRGPDGYVVVPGSAGSPTILHVPHSSWVIPPAVRQHILLGDEELDRELVLMTDAHTDRIAGRAAEAANPRPWQFVSRLSRLVIDPERFPDDREEMRRVGMGAVYTRTSHGEPLRRDDAATERVLLETWFGPYADAFADLVDARLAANGRATIIDVHSYPSTRLPYEVGRQQRPAVCLGTHPAHTPAWLLTAAKEAFGGDVGENTPFEGCYVPLKHFGTDERVTALMVEIRRDTYMTEPGGPPTGGLTTVSRRLAALINAVTRGSG
jgi:N-formylglutamate amidohydrolase